MIAFVLIIRMSKDLTVVLIWIMPNPPQIIGEGFLIQFSISEFASVFLTCSRNLSLDRSLEKLDKFRIAVAPVKQIARSLTGINLQPNVYVCPHSSTFVNIIPSTNGHWENYPFVKDHPATRCATHEASLSSDTLTYSDY